MRPKELFHRQIQGITQEGRKVEVTSVAVAPTRYSWWPWSLEVETGRRYVALQEKDVFVVFLPGVEVESIEKSLGVIAQRIQQYKEFVHPKRNSGGNYNEHSRQVEGPRES